MNDEKTRSYEAKSIVDYANKLDDRISELERQLVVAKTSFGKIKPFEKYNQCVLNSDCSDAEFENKKTLYEANLEIAKRNEAIAKENQELINKYVSSLIASGLNPKSDKRKKGTKYEHESADWVKSLNQAAPGLAYQLKEYSLKENWEGFVRQRNKAKEDKVRADNLEKMHREQEALASKRIIVVTKLCIQLGLDPEKNDVGSLIDYLRGRDKYLDLAVAMLETRLSWSDGCRKVDEALGRFVVESQQDSEIKKDVASCTENFEDGRVFRDTTWNYDVLFGMAKPEVKTMYSELVSVKETE